MNADCSFPMSMPVICCGLSSCRMMCADFSPISLVFHFFPDCGLSKFDPLWDCGNQTSLKIGFCENKQALYRIFTANSIHTFKTGQRHYISVFVKNSLIASW